MAESSVADGSEDLLASDPLIASRPQESQAATLNFPCEELSGVEGAENDAVLGGFSKSVKHAWATLRRLSHPDQLVQFLGIHNRSYSYNSSRDDSVRASTTGPIRMIVVGII